MSTLFRKLLIPLLCLLPAATGWAQYEASVSTANRLDQRRAHAVTTLSGGGVTSITVTNGGSYATAPLVTIESPASGTAATAIAVLGGLTSASFTISSGTTIYSAAPTVTISGGGGSGATAVALMDGEGHVRGIAITSIGSGYTTAPSISFANGTITTSGTAPTGTGNADNFSIISITLNTPGSGYSSRPQVRIAPPPALTVGDGAALDPTQGQFAGMGQMTGSAGPGNHIVSITMSGSRHGGNHPNNKYINVPSTLGLTAGMLVTGTGLGGPATIVRIISSTRYELSSAISGGSKTLTHTRTTASLFPASLNGTIVLRRARIGSPFSSGVPRYFLGDEILRPDKQANGTSIATADYWRAEPLRPGEVLSAPLVTGTDVPVSPIPSGTTEVYYWSIHAEKVFAAQPGRVSITWVTRQTHGGKYLAKKENFVVSATSIRPARTIYWTERTFDGPRVAVRDNRINTISPVFYAAVPQNVVNEVIVPGIEPVPNTDPGAVLKTLWFDRVGTEGSLRAYNIEGRVMIEYLGSVRAGANVHEFLGSDVVNIVRAPDPNYVTVHLGQEIKSHDNDPTLIPAPKLQTVSPSPYGTVTRPNGTVVYSTERETGAANEPDDGSPASGDAYNQVVFYWLEEGTYGMQWPKHQDRYWQRWSPNLADYAHYTVDTTTGSTPATGLAFSGGVLPQIIYQDDPEQSQAAIDIQSQRFYVTFDNGETRNRSLLKFFGGGKVWYVPLYTQAEDRKYELDATADGSSTLTLNGTATTAGLEVGMIVTGTGITGTVTILGITDAKTLILSSNVSVSGTYAFTVQPDGAEPIVSTATVGARIAPPAGHELAGYISGGTGYYPAGYLNPHSAGMPAANNGAIIPVNALPSDKVLTVRWFKKVAAPSADFQDFYVPGKVGRYTVSYPVSTTPQIVIAEGVGTNDLEAWEAAGSVYYQNNATLPGYNPNEEHAFMLGTRAYALREDLNVITNDSSHTSEPFLLLAYTAQDQRPAMRPYKVVRTVDTGVAGVEDQPGDILFDYTATAGTLLVKPYPLPLMPLPLVGTGVNRTSKDLEVVGADDPTNGTVASEDAYTSFTFEDRKGFTWVHRGTHAGGTGVLTMKLYYLSQEGFFVPGTSNLAVGTVLPFLRHLDRKGIHLDINAINANADGTTGDADEPLTVIYRPAWPTNAPELRVGETLTLPKFGLPQVRGQISAQVLYQQSIAQAGTATQLTENSVTLHDPTREKTARIDAAGLLKLPGDLKTTSHLGKTYFQGLPPDLQERIYFDPLRGPKGTIVLKGVFHDEIAGEDYLDLNLLTEAEETTLKGLVPTGGSDKSKWENAIDALSTDVQTFKPALGAPTVESTVTEGENDLADITSPNTAVDSYALSATGQGAGWVTLVFGDGAAFTPVGDPVQVKVIKVAPQLYTGDIKVILSKNPLDEQVRLRHSADFAGQPGDYDFEWRWAPGAAKAPLTYTQSWSLRLGGGSAFNQWVAARNPSGDLPDVSSYSSTAEAYPRSVVIRDSAYVAGSGWPGLVLKPNDATSLDFTTAGVPGEMVFSATLGDNDGFVLYVNGVAALAHQAPPAFTNTDAASDLVPGALAKQFRVSRNYFLQAQNRIEVAVFTNSDAGVSSGLDFRLDVTVETDVVAANFQSVNDTEDKNTNTALVGGDVSLPFGGPQFVLNDRWFTMRYKPRTAGNVAGTGWSRWLPPQFVEGWIKRVLRDINPFEQRVKDMFNNSISTDTSVLTQAGSKWEGDIALTLDNIEDVGLIAIYETVLNRAKSMSIDANTNDPDTNNALMLAAGYLNDLYLLLGNEAYADAANPTISTDDQNSSIEINTSRFSFENQVASSLEEELALLRGRDATSTAVNIAPAYNRLYWNYTGGINAGEVLYATNYNIKEKAGSSTADGVIDAADAYRMFPQGHGDAYGHYLTALKGYYRLLANPNFNWQRRAEAVSVLGQAVTVDFVDERKLAASASLVARSAEQISALTHRQQYKDNAAAGWTHFRDPVSGRKWGLDQWTSRAAQGAYYHWAVANALLPDQDNYHTGVEKIDRTTVPELNELAAAVNSCQTTADNASSRLNPLGLAPGAIAFDLSPAEIAAGKSHYEQISDRAVTAIVNAAGSFNQAARMTRLLRNQENQVDDDNTAIVEQERAYRNELIEIFGRPYAGDVGPGKTYAQDFHGPDLEHWFVVDRPFADTPNAVVDTIDSTTATLRILKPTGRDDFTDDSIRDIISAHSSDTITFDVTVYPNQFIQYSDVFMPGMDIRPETGELQSALLDSHLAYMDLKDAMGNVEGLEAQFAREGSLLLETLKVQIATTNLRRAHTVAVFAVEQVKNSLEAALEAKKVLHDTQLEYAKAVLEGFPRVAGTSVDPTFAARFASISAIISAWGASKAADIPFVSVIDNLELSLTIADFGLTIATEELGFSLEQKQQVYEFEQVYGELLAQVDALSRPALAYQRANERVRNVLARGLRVLEERESFRQRSAAIIQGYRTKDVTFRVFRNEALEQYRSLFDLAGRYTYLAAKSYDYETGLLGTTEGDALISSIVSSRSLGDVQNGTVQATTSTLGDAGLAGTMARLAADFSVAEGRLGINNPDTYNTIFSLRGELFRILDDPTQTSDDEAWQQTLEQHFRADVLADADVATWCRNIKKPNGTPVPGVIIPFSTSIQHGHNLFGLPLAAGDHAYSATSFATKISSVGIALPGYIGMDEYATGNPTSGTPALSDPNALSATPYLYLVPTGNDYMLAPPLGDTNTIRVWQVQDQALPLPFNLGNSAFNSTQFFNASGTLSEKPWVLRKHQAFRPVADPALLLNGAPAEFTNSRLIARSVWNSGWKIVIPAYTLLNNEQEGLNRFARTVRDVRLFIRSYSHSGN